MRGKGEWIVGPMSWNYVECLSKKSFCNAVTGAQNGHKCSE